jgi:chorismate-pyruvate lyase
MDALIPHRGDHSPTSASLVADALAQSRLTVTEFIEDLVGEPMMADKLAQFEVSAVDDSGLGVEVGHPLLRREVLLRGRRSLRPYVHAESWLVPDRLPGAVIERLTQTDTPIGRALVEQHLSYIRVDVVPIHSSNRSAYESVYARNYRIDIGNRPALRIAERFLNTLTPYLATKTGR